MCNMLTQELPKITIYLMVYVGVSVRGQAPPPQMFLRDFLYLLVPRKILEKYRKIAKYHKKSRKIPEKHMKNTEISRKKILLSQKFLTKFFEMKSVL